MGAVERFEERVTEAIAELLDATRAESVGPTGSRALAYAVEAGFPPQMAYSFRDAAAISGVPEKALRDAAARGDLRTFMPEGRDRGALVLCDSLDDYMGVVRRDRA